MESNSRENSPDLGRKKSRRKPTVTHKITDEIDKIDPDADTSFDYLQAVEENNKEKKDDKEHLVNGDSNDTVVKDEEKVSLSKNGHKKEDFIIPEGTVIVEPEAVEETKKEEYKGPEWKATKRLSRSAALGIIQCTACNKQINTNNAGAAKRHPVLKVLICKRCYSWYASAEIEQDSDGMDEQCRWCGDGGNLICCDFCHNAFCKSCIKKNLGRKELSDIVDAGTDDKSKWHCYVCDPKPLANTIADCTLVLEGIDKDQQKVDEKKKDKKDVVQPVPKGKSVPTPQQNRATKQSQVAKKSTTPGKHSTTDKVKPKSAMTVSTPGGNVVLPPGAIPVKTVINKAGNQVIVLQQPPTMNRQVQNVTNIVKSSGVRTKANDTQLQIISNAVKNVSLAMAKGKSQISVIQKRPQEVKTVKSHVVRYEWDAPINEYNVGQALDRTLAVTESLRMVMVSLKDDMKKANSYPVQQCLEKKRIVAAKIRRAMGAFKKQVLDIEHFCKTTAKTVPQAQKQLQSRQEKTSQQQKNKQPFPVSLLKNKRPVESKDSGKSKKDVEVIELSDSSDDESSPKNNKGKVSSSKNRSTKDVEEEDSPNKDKKNFQLKLRLGGSADSLGNNKRKRKHSADTNGSEEGSEKENENHNKETSSTEEKKVPEKRKKKSDSSDDEPLQSRLTKRKSDSGGDGKDASKLSNKKNEEDDNKTDDKEVTETGNEEGNEIIADSESDSEVKEDVQETTMDETDKKDEDGEDDVKGEGETDPMDTEDEVDSEDKKVPDDHRDDLVSKQESDKETVKDQTSEKKKQKEGESESESDSEVKESLEEESDNETSKVVEEEFDNETSKVGEDGEDSHGDDGTSHKENTDYSKDLFLDNDDDEGSKQELLDEGMEVDTSELRDSKISSDGEKLDFEQLDGSKDSRKSKRKKREEEAEGDTGFGGLKFQPLFDVGSSSDINGTDKGEVKGMLSKSGVRSRNDIEAQRELHRELLEDSSSDDDEDADNSEAKMEQDDLSLDSSSSDSSLDSNGDVDYTPKAENHGDKDSHKKTAGKQSKHNKLKHQGGATRRSRRFGEKPVEKTKEKVKSTRKTVADDSDNSNAEKTKNTKKQKTVNSKKSTQRTKHSKSGKKKTMDSDDSGNEEKSNGKRSVKNKGGDDKKKRRKFDDKSDESSQEEIANNSTDYDSELEKDIEKLARVPQILSKKVKSSKKSESPNSDDEKTTKKNSGSQKDKPSNEKTKREERMDELSDGEESDMDDVDEAEEEEDLQTAGDRALAELEQGLNIPSDDDDEEEKARQELLADDSPESSDSDVDEMLAEKSESKKSRVKTSDAEQDESEGEESQDSDKSSKKASSKKSKFGKNELLDAALSDSEEDFEIKSSKKKGKNNADESFDEDDEDSEDEDEDDDEDDEGEEDEKEALTDVSSDFDLKPKKKVAKKKKKKSSDSDSGSDSDDSGGKGKKGKKGKKKGRKRIKVASDSDEEAKSGESGEEDGSDDGKGKKRKKIRKLIKDKKLSVDTKSAAKAEEERRQRIKDRQKQYNQIDEEDVNSPTKTKITTKLVLEMDEETKKPVIEVNTGLIRKLKPHQVEAVRFMWDCCIETTDRAKEEEGAGCILAHCMGLGKTLSVITFIHTLMKNAELTRIHTCLIVCPLNTVLNWQRELGHWLDKKEQLLVDELTSVKDNYGRCRLLEDWQKSGGCMIMGYEMYRNLSTLRNIKKAKQKKILTSCLIDPGPDIVVCDEGHILKNDASALSKAMSKIKTKRRIALTGTPLQNNLSEYHCMVDFVKPKLLGTRKEFMNRFVNPIKNGQCSDSSDHDVKLMKKRAHILHEKLAGCVQRKDYSALTKFLPPKHEYVILVRLSDIQMELYEKYLQRVVGYVSEGEKIKGVRLFSDYQALMRIWTHPWVLKLQEIREELKKVYDDTDEDDSFLDDSDDDSLLDQSSHSSSSEQEQDSVQEISSDSDTGRNKRTRNSTRNNRDQRNGKKGGEVVKSWKTKSRGGDNDSVKSAESDKKQCENGEEPVSSEWWAEHIKEEDKYSLEISGKMMLLSEVLRCSENIGDKVLVFSQSLLSLDLIEDFLDHWDTDNSESTTAGTMGWSKGLDYFRMDGSTTPQNRTTYANTFNELENVRARLFLISTKAGSLGTNLVGANRVIIFDASWNPSHDTQSIFRVYRFGQTKPVYIYRFLAQGTMEEKIYERQVTKQSLSQRVVDEHQVERHFSNADLTELYNFKPDRYDENKDYIPVLPKDMMLADLLTEKKRWIVKYHEHDSLLENKIEEDLTEEERKSAWEEFEMEKKHGFRPTVRPIVQATGQVHNYNNINTQYARGANNSLYMPPPQFSVKEIEELAKAIYAANPGINQMDLQMRVQTYVTRQQQLYQQRQREQMMHEMARLRHLQDERQRQEQALQVAYSKSQGQGSSATAATASSLLRTLVAGPGQTPKDSPTTVGENTDAKQPS